MKRIICQLKRELSKRTDDDDDDERAPCEVIEEAPHVDSEV